MLTDYALATYLRAQNALRQLDARAREAVADPEGERGNYSTEVAVIVALVVALAIAVVGVIAAKVLAKVNSLSL